VEMQLILCSR